MLYFTNFFVFSVCAISQVYTFFYVESLLLCFLKASTSVLSGVLNVFYFYTLSVLLRLLESSASMHSGVFYFCRFWSQKEFCAFWNLLLLWCLLLWFS